MKTFFFTFPVYYEDTDAGGVVYHANYLRFAERARTQMLKELGFSNMFFLKNEKPVGFAVHDCSLTFHSPAKLEDILTVESRVVKVTGTSLFFEQTVMRGDEKLVDMTIRAVTVTAQWRPTRLPKELAACFTDVEKE